MALIVKAKTISKYKVMEDRLYYESLAPKLAKMNRKVKLENRSNYLGKIKIDFIDVDELLKCAEEQYSGFKLTKKD